MIGRSPTVWYSTITIDKGSDQGLRANQPVVNGDGLVGRVSDVSAGRRAGDADHRPHERRVGAARARRAERPREGDRRQPVRPDPRLRAEGPRGAQGRDRGDVRLALLAARVAVPARHPDRPRDARRLATSASCTSACTCGRSRTCGELDVVEVLTGHSRRGRERAGDAVTSTFADRGPAATALVLVAVVLAARGRRRRSPCSGRQRRPAAAGRALGRLCSAGPVAGATVGFLLGLVADMALLQTLGRQLAAPDRRRLPGRALPRAARRHAQAGAADRRAGRHARLTRPRSRLIQFLLGVESPVSPLVIRDDRGRRAPQRRCWPSRCSRLVRAFLRPDLIDDLRPRRRPVTRTSLQAVDDG